MIEAGVGRPGRTGWPAMAPAPARGEYGYGRGALLAALAAYRRGVGEAPVICKWSAGVGAGMVAAASGLPRYARNDRWGVHRDTAVGAGLLRYARNDRWDGRHDDDIRRDGDSGDSKDIGEDGPLVFVASTGEVDRHGDTVAPDGWRLNGYRENPVVLWAHDYRQPAIGRADGVWSDGRALLARLEFAPTEFAGQVERLYRQGYQRGVSVGFRPLRFEERRDPVNGAFLGIRFLEQELLEISAVPVPANGEALLARVATGDDASRPGEREREAGARDGGGAVAELVALLRGLRG